MAKKGVAQKVRLVSESGYEYFAKVGRNLEEKLKLRKFDPRTGKHEWFAQKKLPPHKKN